ncbi:MAG: 1-acyl-sn-glycerol-3-phosphate acyltransferase [Marinilabiliaceae bacterium]|nr:1-acyl-sn-glycerol-3-phosphate acyltransferase [Marinilabiliaceae bacterium]
MVKTHDFNSIRPFEDHEIHQVFERLKKEKTFLELISFLYPNYSTDDFLNNLLRISSIKEFQFKVIYPYVKEIIKNTTEGLTSSGFDNLDPSKSYLFISNHRDIVLDSAILNILLLEHKFETTEIAIGDNLLIFPWITDLVKLNRSFIVNRNLSTRQLLESSKRLSSYIRHTLLEKKRSVWIAQREGRSKDGDDRTQISLLKMLNIAGENSFCTNFDELNIVPVSISYELDPCDYLKAHEFQIKRDNSKYQKSQKDDLKHMGTGLKGRKGRVHFSIGKPLSGFDAINNIDNKNDQYIAVGKMIDDQIHANYKLWPANYIACDYLCNNSIYIDKYTQSDRLRFESYINEHIDRLENPDRQFIYNTILEMYANPVKNSKT